MLIKNNKKQDFIKGLSDNKILLQKITCTSYPLSLYMSFETKSIGRL